MKNAESIAIVEVGPLVGHGGDIQKCATQIGMACRDLGFFYVAGHGVSVTLQEKLERLSREFFAWPESEKMKLRMELGGAAWRGFFPCGSELTSGKPDLKEGLYFGRELGEFDPRVLAGTPMHGKNLFPAIAEFKATALQYFDAMTFLAQNLMRGVSLSLGLDEKYFYDKYTKDPLELFRIFHYPQADAAVSNTETWGVGAHTDYGLLTILKQDDVGGLEVKTKTGWEQVRPIKNTFVINIGDMLDKVTGGLYHSTLHRVTPATRSRISMPFFFDPNFDAKVIPVREVMDESASDRWDNVSVSDFSGTYGEYLLNKVSKVFPQLKQNLKVLS